MTTSGQAPDTALPAPLSAELEQWARASRRFRAFAEQHERKIQARLRRARGDNDVLAVRAELEAAALLLRDDRFTLEYEPYVAARQRGPDFAVTFKTHTRFNLEVRRVRGGNTADDDEAHLGRLMAILCDKAGQMPPSIVNVLWLSAGQQLPEADLGRATLALLRLAEVKADAFFGRHGFANATDYLKYHGRLSAIVVRQPGGPVRWLNPLARHPAPPAILAAIQRAAGG